MGKRRQECQFGSHAGRQLCSELGSGQGVFRPVGCNENAFIWNPTSALDADQRREPRHAPSKACMLSRQHDSVDILVGARGFFRDAAR